MKTLIFGAGNLLLSDEGFGVHAIRYLEENYSFPDMVELYDGGTLGIMVTHKLEEAERVYVLDVVDADGSPGDIVRFDKEDIILNRLPVKLSPHQIGIQEVLFLAEMRGTCPKEVTIIGAIPQSLEPGVELSPRLRRRLEEVAWRLVYELNASGLKVCRKEARKCANAG
ncbi:MAG TPA: HyaD/HybD family hydrogenase maturation endopeptidase [Geobacteraceae bacterium]|nr:HyaD/HybD family hydrogenase maturation endopeptidase [Geobacteraceae bacterium]